MKRVWHEWRCLIGEMCLHWALTFMPRGSTEELGICMAVEAYRRVLELKKLACEDQRVVDILRGIAGDQNATRRQQER